MKKEMSTCVGGWWTLPASEAGLKRQWVVRAKTEKEFLRWRLVEFYMSQRLGEAVVKRKVHKKNTKKYTKRYGLLPASEAGSSLKKNARTTHFCF